MRLTIAISLRSNSRCCSKNDFSAGCALREEAAGGRVVLDISVLDDGRIVGLCFRGQGRDGN